MIAGFILHFVGDYLLQNDWMAAEKTKNNGVALVHAGIYSMPFFLLAPSFWWLLIFGTHFFIDRYRLAQYWIRLVNRKWDGDNFGFSEEKPKMKAVDFEKSALEHGLAIGSKKDFLWVESLDNRIWCLLLSKSAIDFADSLNLEKEAVEGGAYLIYFSG